MFQENMKIKSHTETATLKQSEAMSISSKDAIMIKGQGSKIKATTANSKVLRILTGGVIILLSYRLIDCNPLSSLGFLIKIYP